MGKWNDNEQKMKSTAREAIIKALWDKINAREDLEGEGPIDPKIAFENKMRKYHILKIVLGLFQEENNQYVETEQSRRFDKAILEENFEEFRGILLDSVERSKDLKLSSEEIEAELDKKLAEIQNGEHLSLPMVDLANPTIMPEDMAALKEYMEEMKISAAVAITNQDKSFVLDDPKFGTNPVFSIHSVAKVFTGVLLMKMMNEGIIKEDDLNKPVELSEEVLSQLSPQVQERLKQVTLKQLMLHESGLGDYLDNLDGLSSEIERKLNNQEEPPNITSSNDLLKYGDKEVTGTPGQFKYSNLGMLLLGFAIEKKYQDTQRAKKEEPLLGIDELMRQFAKDIVKVKTFEHKCPINGHFNTVSQRNPQRMLLTDKGPEFVKRYVAARFGCTAGGYWTTNEDLQKFGEWIKAKCAADANFNRLIETHGGEFYNSGKQAVEHSGLHADTAHFYVSLRNGTVITVLSDQGERAATNLVDMILKQTTWYKISTSPQTQETASPDLGQGIVSPISSAFDKSMHPSIVSKQEAPSANHSALETKKEEDFSQKKSRKPE